MLLNICIKRSVVLLRTTKQERERRKASLWFDLTCFFESFTYVQDCMQVLFNKYFIFDRLICHFHITSLILCYDELTVMLIVE